MNTNHSISTNDKRKMIALGVVLIIGGFLVVFLKGKRPEETPTAKARPAVQETAPLVEFDAAAHFRDMHNRALSPEAREDNRRKLWKKNFPWKPTYDPAVKATADMLSMDDDTRAVWNHYYLKAFFESDLRFSPQFEQLYRIMEKYDRTDNPIALAWLFENLRTHHQLMQGNPEDYIIGSDGTPWIRRATGKPWTRGELAADYKECLHAEIDGNVHWPHKEEEIPDELVESIIEEVAQVPGMAEIKGFLVSASDAHSPDDWDLEEGDSLLVPFVGYQAIYDEWNDERNRNVAIGLAKLYSQRGEEGRMMPRPKQLKTLDDSLGIIRHPNKMLILLKSAKRNGACKKPCCANWKNPPDSSVLRPFLFFVLRNFNYRVFSTFFQSHPGNPHCRGFSFPAAN